ncbi:uncharacterized protein LOC131648355 isoform X2 [Vicia villosa]|nr:uncharacterized protein LOC131648355 isoform X2 [Vicia villosa]XP_058774099.1 uncharacterized protein LOC131648355 isoform X2 [Vicia villosa]
MSWDMELDRLLGDLNDSSSPRQNILEPWENWRGGDCREALKVPDSWHDVIESSSCSSFGDTTTAASFGEPEVESRMFTDSASLLMFDGGHEPLRQRKKRKTTAHWRRFISPVMSRCKWVELKLNQLKSQEHKYAKELAALDYTQDINKDMKRKKRRRVEENCDLASYMSNHTLFSYYEKADCNVDAGLEDCHEVVTGGESKNSVEFKSNDLWSSVGNYGNDKSWDDAIQKIIALESQLQILKSRHDKVISENQGRFCSVNQSSMLEPSYGYNHPDSFTGNASSGDDRVVLLSKTTNRPQMDDPRDNINVEDFTQYQTLKEGFHELENVGNKLVKQIESFGEIKEILKFHGSESDNYENAVHNGNVRSNLKSCSTLKSKVPRHERKRKKISGSKRSRRSG